MTGAKRFDTKRLVALALFTAIVVVLQYLGQFIRFGMFSISLVLVPIVVGAALYGAKAGGWLGLVFAIAVFLTGDAAAFLSVNPFGTIVVVVLKGVLAGFCAGFVYRKLEKVNMTLAVFVAAVVCPIVNTGIFLIGCRLFFWETVQGWAEGMGFGDNAVAYMFLGLAGGNFLFELLVNVILGPVIVRLIQIGRKQGIGDKASASKPKAVVCPGCGASVVPNAEGKCEYCGAALSGKR